MNAYRLSVSGAAFLAIVTGLALGPSPVAPFPAPAGGGTGPAAEGAPPPRPSIEGGWEAVDYVLASGPVHPVRGRIVFTRDEWLVLFFVMERNEPRRGSGEGGRYTLDGDRLIFEHLFHLSAGEEMEGLPASPLELTAREGDGPLEPTRVERDGDRLTLHFPSGNAMRFRRSSAP